MKRVIFGAVLALLSTNSWAFAEKSNNDMIKDCLQATGYDYNLPADKRITDFDWESASYCVAGFQEKKHKKRLAEQKEFIKNNPWYKGPNWRWELRAEYKCNTVYSAVGPIEVCSKPYYVN